MRKIAWLLVLLMLPLAGCVSTNEPESDTTAELESLSEEPGATTETELSETEVSDPVPSEEPTPTDEQGAAEEQGTTEFAYSAEAQAAIEGLYVNLWNEEFAASYLGYREEGDTSTLSEWLQDNCPMLTSFWPFLAEIPEEDIVGDHGYLYCIVPMDASVQFTVKGLEWENGGDNMPPSSSEVLYVPQLDRPFLLYSTCESWVDNADVVLEFVEADGFEGVWTPVLEPDGSITNPLAQDGGYTIVDFASLYDIGDYVPHLQSGTDADSGWLPPTETGLANTTWYSDNGWLLSFGEDGNAEDGMVLYYTEGEEGTLTPYYEGTWWMEDDGLCLGVYDGNCPFPLLISPSGEQLVIMRADDGSVLPFFVEGQTICSLSIVYG